MLIICVLRILSVVDVIHHQWLEYYQYFSDDPGLKPSYDINICLIHSTLFIEYKLIYLKSISAVMLISTVSIYLYKQTGCYVA
jgi:hypothetical protein